MKEMQEHATEGRLRKIREELGIGRKDLNSVLEEYDRTLDSVFKKIPIWTPLNPHDDLEKQSEYARWMNSPRSSLLLLYGRTRSHPGDCCWLSPAAHHIMTEVTSTHKCEAFATCLCQPNKYFESDIPVSQVFRDLAYQLIEQCGDHVRVSSMYEQINQRTTAAAAARPGNLEVHCSLLEQAMAPYRSLMLLIDRSDCIKGDTWWWLEHFVKLMNRLPPSVKLKILLIASSNGNREPGDPYVTDSLREKLGDRFCELELDRP